MADAENISLCKVFTGHKVEEVAGRLENYPAVYIVVDKNIRSFAERIGSALLPYGNFRGSLAINATENAKTMETVLEICHWLLENKADRKALLLAVGGGITTDMAGFAASMYKRGIRFAYVPTTLLAQVDAAIGGKTGVNFEGYKNILGVIRQPEFTFECPEVLETLPYRDFLSGAAELVKTFIIDNSGENYEKAIALLSALRSADSGDSVSSLESASCHFEPVEKSAAQSYNNSTSDLSKLEDLIASAALIKAGVVQRDQFENGERRKLNLGHTFAHAIEWEARKNNDDISHGEAVAMGIVMASIVSEKYYGIEGLASRIIKDFSVCGLAVNCPYPIDRLSDAMQNDKKAEGGKVHFVLIAGIGDVRIEELTVSEVIEMLESKMK